MHAVVAEDIAFSVIRYKAVWLMKSVQNKGIHCWTMSGGCVFCKTQFNSNISFTSSVTARQLTFNSDDMLNKVACTTKMWFIQLRVKMQFTVCEYDY